MNIVEQRESRDLTLRFMRVLEVMFKRMANQKDHPFKELNVNQIRALRELHYHPGLLQKGLAEVLGVTPAAVSAIVRHMQAMDLITRQTDSDDARSVRLFLSEGARQMVEENYQLRCSAVGDLLNGLPIHEQKAVVEALERSLNLSKENNISTLF